MLKLTAILNHRVDSSLEAFSHHWRTIHRPLALRLVEPGFMLGYVQNHRIPLDIPGLAPPGDGVPEVWVPSVAAVQRLAVSPEYLEGAWLDEPNFMEGRARAVVGDERLVFARRERQQTVHCPKLMLFAKRAPSLTAREFKAAVACSYESLWAPARPVRHSYEIAVELPTEMGEQPYDLIASLWWHDRRSLHEAWRNLDLRQAGKILDIARLEGMLVSEEPVFWPQTL